MLNCAIYYYPNTEGRKKGYGKFKRIKEAKLRKGYKILQIKQTKDAIIGLFSDGECWMTIPAEVDRMKGIRWQKAFVDRKIPIEYLKNFIGPSGINAVEDFRLY